MNDFQIISSSLFEFAFFFASQIIVFRKIRQNQFFRWLINLFVFTFVGFSIFYLIFLQKQKLLLSVFELFLINFLYSLFVFVYVVLIVGAIQSSIRVKILLLIYKAGKGGLAKSMLYRIYNRQTIVQDRLDRLLDSGDLIFQQGKYRQGKKFSFILIPEFITRMMWQWYYGVQL